MKAEDSAAPTAGAPAESAAASSTDETPKPKTETADGDATTPAAAVKAEENDDDEEVGGDDDEEDYDASEGATGDGPPDTANAQKKRRERLEQNRISARESRKRKKTMIEELQRTVITLSKENKDLNDRNEQLRSQLMEIGRKVRMTEFLLL